MTGTNYELQVHVNLMPVEVAAESCLSPETCCDTRDKMKLLGATFALVLAGSPSSSSSFAAASSSCFFLSSAALDIWGGGGAFSGSIIKHIACPMFPSLPVSMNLRVCDLGSENGNWKPVDEFATAPLKLGILVPTS
jgi:hypothetical protein